MAKGQAVKRETMSHELLAVTCHKLQNRKTIQIDNYDWSVRYKILAPMGWERVINIITVIETVFFIYRMPSVEK